MQVTENYNYNKLSVIKLPCDKPDSLTEAYFSGRLTTEKCDSQACHGHAGKMGAYRTQFLKLGFAQRQILLVIFELHFDFPPFFMGAVFL